MFFYTKQFQYNATPGSPNPVFAKQMQEILGGQWGEISVMMGYLFQGSFQGPDQKARPFREEPLAAVGG